jgi:AraC family transcriptional regulator
MEELKPLSIDFRQEGASDQLFSHPPLLTSHYYGWNGIHVEHHLQPNHDTPEHQLTTHCIPVLLGSPILNERWFGSRFHREFMPRGSFAVIPAGESHRSISGDAAEFLILSIEPEFVDRVAQDWHTEKPLQLIPQFALEPNAFVLEIGLALKKEMEAGCPAGSLYGDSLATALVAYLLRHYATFKPQPTAYADGLSKHKLNQALEYIHTHLELEIKLEDLAKVVGISPYYFCRLFKQSVGVAPYRYVIQQRVERAKQLLKNAELVIADVALQCGFASQSHFTKHFRQFTGITPRVYRESLYLVEQRC